MSRLTKQQTKQHDEAEALLSLTRPLSETETEFVFEHWSPMANHNVGKNAVFFTPPGLADEVALCAAMSDGGARYLDLCAGIGRLTYSLMRHCHWDAKPSEFICLEINPAFVEVGRKLVPQAKWVLGSVFDLDILREIGPCTRGLSNPPFGNIITKRAGDWLSFSGPADLMVAEVAIRMCEYGAAMILPSGSFPFDANRPKQVPEAVEKWSAALPGYSIGWSRPNIDTRAYKDEWHGTAPAVELAEVGEEDYTHGALGLPPVQTLF